MNARSVGQDLGRGACNARSGGDATHADIADVIVSLCSARGSAKSICPSDAARAIAGDGGDWRALMPDVRAVAVALANAGQIVVTQKRKPVDLRSVKGPVRLAIVEAGDTGADTQG